VTRLNQLQEASRENERLKEQNEQMVEHVSSLESRLNKASQLNSPSPPPDTTQLDKLAQDLQHALEENNKLKSHLENQVRTRKIK